MPIALSARSRASLISVSILIACSGILKGPCEESIGIYTTIMHNKTMYYINHKLPLLLERVGVRRIKSISYIPPHPIYGLLVYCKISFHN
jgi:hypothetical protein